MSKKNVILVASLMLGFVAAAQADIIHSYDFDSLATDQKLVGQDGWFFATAANQLHYVKTASSGDWNGTGNKFAEQVGAGTGVAKYPVGTLALEDNNTFDFSFDTRAVTAMTYKGYVQLYYNSGSTTDSYLSIGAWSPSGMTAGLYWAMSNSGTIYLQRTIAVPSSTSDLVKVGITFNALGGDDWSVQPYYQMSGGDITAAGAAVTLNDFRPSIGNYGGVDNEPWNEYQLVSLTTGWRADNILLTQVPEPSTLALLACGLVGLLAYAWRKRK
ncbi:MAG: PEP-CTERM sorting domain-containing protein [Pirellulales bacterium]|nr:PEP-CTERM sorting domain-containing protein [Pirellulales bacterium]